MDRGLLSKIVEMKLLDTVSDLIRVVNRKNKLVYFNTAMEKAWEEEEAQGSGEDEGLRDFRMTARSLSSGEIIQRETYVGNRYYSVKTNPIRSDEGTIIGAIEVFRDKSLEKQLQIELIEKNRALIEEQQNASNIQHALLPRRGYISGMRMEYFYRPSEILSGDFFDIIELDDDHVAFYIADAVGHGFASSMTTLFISQTMRNMDPQLLLDPSMAMMELVHRFRELNLPPNLYFTIFLAVYDDKSHTLTYVNAGHDCPPLLKRNSHVRLLLNTGFPVTPLVEPKFYECRSAFIRRGDELLLYTDGITECRAKNKEQYGLDRLKLVFSQCGEEPLEEIKNHLKAYIHEEIVDDMTCVYLKML